MTLRDDATKAQVDAARPDASTWLAANAGSGKTRVLTDRVARLLLGQVEPQHILCLTYTKAAASEMQNRLFQRLGEWAMLDATKLEEALRDLGVEGDIDAARLRDARTLFARAIETPGGLKIQTIHSFCASLLRRFPLEAGVSPQFTEIEDRAADLLRAEIVDAMAEGSDAVLISDLARHYTGDDFGKLTRAIVQRREAFSTPLDWVQCLALFGQPEALSTESIEANVFLGAEREILDAIIPVLQASTTMDQKTAQSLLSIDRLDISSLPELERIFLFASGATPGQPKTASSTRPAPTKSARKLLAAVEPALDAFMERIADARVQRIGLKAAEKTYALHRFAARFLPLYEDAKTQRGWLDFDDLIDRARALLNDENVAAWVLWRIDGGIDHILVDEAQDTSPAQWDVVRKLAAEFTSGQGAREDVERTIFVVGDKKQSIYSFQGADSREFDRMQQEFEVKLAEANRLFHERTLKYSFRSSPAILEVVDNTFDGEVDAGFSADASHIAFQSELPGRVDLWPLVEPQPKQEDAPWYDPVDRKSDHHHEVTLANRIAGQIKRMIDRGQMIPFQDPDSRQLLQRPVTAGDFLILVQRRSTLFAEVIRACKTAQLDIAGADKLKVGGELAVRDLAALLSFLDVPEDSLSLASALKSPLFGWSEQALFDLAHRRSQDYLWQELRERADEYPETMAVLNDLRQSVNFLRPYDLIERILTRHKGRRNLLARLGTEAEDGINALLSQALAYERNAVPSLTGFLVWMETDDLEIKRQIDSASDQIRVMTVHGAKGLESPIVILPDSGKRIVRIQDDIIDLDGIPVWKAASNEMPSEMSAALDARKTAETEERLRLLYVALTRAEKWLIVAAAGDLSTESDTWYQRVEAALDAKGAELVDFQDLAVKRLSHGDWDALPVAGAPGTVAEQSPVEPFFFTAAPPPLENASTLTASDLGGAKALAGDSGRDEESAKAYGTLVHRFLEHFSAAPQSNWPTIAATVRSPVCDDRDHREAETEARRILNTPALNHLFDANSLSEIPITARLGGHPLYGVIDRLVVTADKVLAVDFKTNRTVPDRPENCPEGLLRQMGAYYHALSQVYPDRTVSVAILWTQTATLMGLPHEIVIHALQNTPYLDDLARAT